MSAPESSGPRWTLSLVPLPNGEASMDIEAAVEGVSCQELALVMVKALAALIANGSSTVPSSAQVKELRRRAALIESNPATKLLTKGGATLWLGDADVITRALAAEWLDAGAPPEDVKRACDYAIDPERVDKIIGAVAEA